MVGVLVVIVELVVVESKMMILEFVVAVVGSAFVFWLVDVVLCLMGWMVVM